MHLTVPSRGSFLKSMIGTREEDIRWELLVASIITSFEVESYVSSIHAYMLTNVYSVQDLQRTQ